jgi:SPP1 family holin
METPRITSGTIARTITLITALVFAALAGINQILAARGLSPIKADAADITSTVSYICTVAASLWAWWKPNNFTEEARKKYDIAQTIREEMLLQEAKKKYATYPIVEKTQTVEAESRPELAEEKTTDAKQTDIDNALKELHKAVEAL